jgi:hypothetical protein
VVGHLGATHGDLLMVFEKIKPCSFSLVIGDDSIILEFTYVVPCI